MTIITISAVTLLYNTSSKLGIQNSNLYEKYIINKSDTLNDKI